MSNSHTMYFLPVFELMLDSVTIIEVEPHQCPWHHSQAKVADGAVKVLVTQGIGETYKSWSEMSTHVCAQYSSLLHFTCDPL